MTHNELLRYLGLNWTWSIQFDPESNCWVANIGELPDFFAAGSTPAEAAMNARDALQSHLSGYLSTGTPIPTPPSRIASVSSKEVQTRTTQELTSVSV